KNTSRRGTVMLRAMQQVMAAEGPRVRGNRRLELARREGARYWRDHFARAAIRELYRQTFRGKLSAALKTLGALLWYARGRVLFVPWKYRKRLLERIRLRLLPGRSKSVAGA